MYILCFIIDYNLLSYLAVHGLVAVFTEVYTSSADFLVHWLISCDSLLSHM